MKHITRFSRIKNNAFQFEVNNYVAPKIVIWESVTDKSQFRPNIDDVRLFEAAGGSSNVPLYDFEDGIDNGLRLTQLRSKSADITEIASAKETLENLADQDKKDAELILKKEVEKVTKKVNVTSDNKTVTE